MIGTIIAVTNSYFFIQPQDPFLENVFGHKSQLLDGRKRVIFGEVVSYEIGVSEKTGRPAAINIRVIQPVVEPMAGIAPKAVV